MVAPLVPAAKLARVRAKVARSHQSTCQLLNPPGGRGVSGGSSGSDFVPAGSPLPCRVDPPTREPRATTVGGIGAEISYEVAFGHGTPVSPRQRVEVVGTGQVLEIVAVADLGTFAAEVVASCADVD